jgi:hypothetical protein
LTIDEVREYEDLESMDEATEDYIEDAPEMDDEEQQPAEIGDEENADL